MKLKVPGIKKNKETQSEGPVFDLTGGSNSSAEMLKSSAADNSFGLIAPEEDAFSVSVRNVEPLIRRIDGEKKRLNWTGDIQLNLSSAAILMVILGLLFTAADVPELVFFALPGFLVYMLIATMGSFDDDKIKRIRLIVAAAMGIALIAALIVFRNYISSGWALIMDHLYDTAEIAQAYIYDRFHVGAMGEEHPYRSMHFAAIWGSCLLGIITALPPARFRRPLAMIIAAFSMIAFAYYGIIPSWVCIAVMAAAIVFLLSRGSIMSTATVLLAMMIVFGAVTLIDPGENYGISRADENFRDRFALISSYLDSSNSSLEGLDELEQQMQDQQDQETEDGGSEFMAEHRGLIVLAVIALILAALGAAAGILIKRIRDRQAKNRAGLDSSDPKKAIIAMFPYAVKWLQPAGIETTGKNFSSLMPVIRADVSEEYAERYKEMYTLWQEAAYSDHEMTEEGRNKMNSFMSDTIDMIRDKTNLRTRLVNTVKYTL